MSARSATASACASPTSTRPSIIPSRGPFDGKYMQALYDFGVAAGKKGTAFDAALPELSMRAPGNQ